MKLYSPWELPGNPGDIFLLYGPTGVGKTVTCLQTARLPILHFLTEPRDPDKFLKAANRPELEDKTKKNIKFAFYESWDDTMNFFSDPKNTKGANTIITDSITFLSNIQLTTELTDETFEARDPSKDKGKNLIAQTKMSVEAWGGLSGQLKRFTNVVSKLSQEGKTIIFLALQEDNPKFDRSLSAGPALSGKDFPKVLPGFCDFIGLVEPRIELQTNEKTNETKEVVVYPPKVRFASDGTFMAKWTGLESGRVPFLHIEKILAVAHGRLRVIGREGKGGKKGEPPMTEGEQLSLPIE